MPSSAPEPREARWEHVDRGDGTCARCGAVRSEPLRVWFRPVRRPGGPPSVVESLANVVDFCDLEVVRQVLAE